MEHPARLDAVHPDAVGSVAKRRAVDLRGAASADRALQVACPPGHRDAAVDRAEAACLRFFLAVAAQLGCPLDVAAQQEFLDEPPPERSEPPQPDAVLSAR